MKIMHLLPALSSGGVEQVVLELCEGITACGEECVVVSAGGSMVEQILQKGARHITLPIGEKSPATVWHALRLARLLHAERPDILHVHSRVPAWAGFLACHLLHPQERPCVVTTFHGFYSVIAYSAIMTRSQRIVAVSASIHNHILTAYPSVPPDRVLTIPNSIDTNSFNPKFHPSSEWRQRWEDEHPELKGKFVLCLPGRITRIKGQVLISNILRRLLDKGVLAHALIVGETKRGKEKFLRELENLYEREGVSQAISWLGHRSDLREVMCVSDVVLSLTLQPESFGKTTLEALALGRPVAGFDHGGVSEQLQEYLPEGRVAVGDTMAIADLLARWHKNPPHLTKPVGSPYLREDMIRAHLELYKQLLNTP